MARKLSGDQKALLIAVACSDPPAGRARWTLEQLCDEMVRLAENRLKPWRKDRRRIPKADAAYVAAMEDVLDFHNYPHAPRRARSNGCSNATSAVFSTM